MVSNGFRTIKNIYGEKGELSVTKTKLDKGIENLLAQRELKDVILSDLIPNVMNPRDNFVGPHMDRLRSSIAEMGILQPLLATKLNTSDKLMIIDGERRWKCAVDLQLETVPVNVFTKEPSDDDKYRIMLHIHRNRVDWESWERIEVVQHMIMKFQDESDSKIANRLGMKSSNIKMARIVMSYPQDLRGSVQKSGFDPDFIIEMDKNLIGLLEFKKIRDDYDKAKLCRIFLQKKQDRVMRKVLDVRKIKKLYELRNQDGIDVNKLEKVLLNLLQDPMYKIQEAEGEMKVEEIYEAETIEKQLERIEKILIALDFKNIDLQTNKKIRKKLKQIHTQLTLIEKEL